MELRPSSIVASLRRRNNLVLLNCYVTWHRCHIATETLTRNIASSLRLLVPSSTQVRRQSADMNHCHLRTKVSLDLVDHVVDPSDVSVTFLFRAGRYSRTRSPSVTSAEPIRRLWRACTRSLASCFLLRAARSRQQPSSFSDKSHAAGIPPRCPPP
jgi:hypothetical protein